VKLYYHRVFIVLASKSLACALLFIMLSRIVTVSHISSARCSHACMINLQKVAMYFVGYMAVTCGQHDKYVVPAACAAERCINLTVRKTVLIDDNAYLSERLTL
jgi:hypothetical protein